MPRGPDTTPKDEDENDAKDENETSKDDPERPGDAENAEARLIRKKGWNIVRHLRNMYKNIREKHGLGERMRTREKA